ncbi:MAG: hypothetical protein ACD_11C00026G0007 [uncultured bacterium]|nr:MAG: hypothetical protein ACD_11C00026G0007 [uncultured bacterium]HBR72051.1 hypothetical protein [Candidatus Moranbacteria bacterium]
MTKKKTYILATALGVVAVAGGIMVSQAFAEETNPNFFGRNYSPERHESISKAIESNDYKAWKELMSGRRMADVINENNFSKFTEMRKLRLEGKIEEANKIREELGLRAMNGTGNFKNRGQNLGGNFVDKDGDGKCDRI